MSDVHVLLGYPATGKLTVGRALVTELQARGRTGRLVDNHLINNPVFGVIAADGKNELPDAVWPLVGQVREAVLTAIEQLSPREWDFVFTNYVTADEADEAAPYFARLEQLAKTRGGQLVVSCLTCDSTVHLSRIDSVDRVGRLKATSPEWLATEIATRSPYVPDRATVHDTTLASPAEIARVILIHRP
ncbi:MAG: hypothetical protein ACYDAQ_05315 [Mycobacteriales bacterium]